MARDEVDAAAEWLVASWREPESLDAAMSQLCGRLAAAVDASGLLAATAAVDPSAATIRVSAALRRARRSDATVAGVVSRLASAKRERARPSTVQKVSVAGHNNTTTVVGGDLVAGSTGSSPRPGSRVPGPADVILLASADPWDLDRLRLGEEIREIRDALDLSTGREQWRIEPWMALRLRDLSRALLQLRPRVVHFSGHGSGEGVFLEDDSGNSHPMPIEGLARVFSAAGAPVECVVLNACFSKSQAQAISAYIPFVVGVPGAVEDNAAITFSIGFYQALGESRGVRQAYELGCALMSCAGTAGFPLPELLCREDR